MKTLKMILVLVFCFGLVQLSLAQQDWEIQSPFPFGIGMECYDVHVFGEDNVILSTEGYRVSKFLKLSNGQWKVIEIDDSNQIKFIFFINDNIGWALVGKHAIWKTVDGGLIWSQCKDFSNCVLKSVFFLNENLGWAVGTINAGKDGLISRTTNGGQSWQNYMIESNDGVIGPFELHDIFFTDENNGWVIGGRGTGLYKTSNSGINWEEQNIIANQETLKVRVVDIFFKDGLTGWIGVAEDIYFGKLLKTIDGGQSWTIQKEELGNNFKIKFIDNKIGWLTCKAEGIWKTTDGGEMWINQFKEESCVLSSASFSGNNYGWAVGIDRSTCMGLILETKDGGEIWSKIQRGVEKSLGSISMIDDQFGWISGGQHLLNTNDGGNSWKILRFYPTTMDGGTWIEKSCFTDNLNGWIIELHFGLIKSNTSYSPEWISSSILKTTNGGLDFNIIDNCNGNMGSIFAYDSLVVWLAGLETIAGGSGIDYKITKTTDGGKNWIDYIFDEPIVVKSIRFSNKNHGGFVATDSSEKGLIMQSVDGGQSWNKHTLETDQVLNNICLIDNETGWVVGDSGTILKKVKGAEFDWMIKPSGTTQNLNAIYMISLKVGLAVGDAGTILRTEDGGETWVSVDLGITQNLYNVQFVNGLIGWIAGDGGLIMKTTNGGLSFVEEYIDYSAQTISNYQLSQNYPNPFNPSTTIKFQIPNSKFTTLKVYNILGKKVAELVSNNLSAGVHQYQFDGSGLASGVYYYEIITGDNREVKKMILLR